MTDKYEQSKKILDNHHKWPCPYVYKFIVPSEKLSQLTDLFPDENIITRKSKSGKYISVTMESTMCSSEEVMDFYARASQVQGLISL